MKYKYNLILACASLAFPTLALYATPNDETQQPQIMMSFSQLNETEKLEQLKYYPAPPKKMTRHAIFLAKQPNEDNMHVELAIGKMLDVDCNKQRLIGKIVQKTIDGWGYTYIEVSDIKGPVSTLMACPTEAKTTRFISLTFDNNVYRYNSKLPIVIYTPEDLNVKYRIWHADDSWQNAE